MKRWLFVASAVVILYLFDTLVPYYIYIEF